MLHRQELTTGMKTRKGKSLEKRLPFITQEWFYHRWTFATSSLLQDAPYWCDLESHVLFNLLHFLFFEFISHILSPSSHNSLMSGTSRTVNEHTSNAFMSKDVQGWTFLHFFFFLFLWIMEVYSRLLNAFGWPLNMLFIARIALLGSEHSITPHCTWLMRT